MGWLILTPLTLKSGFIIILRENISMNPSFLIFIGMDWVCCKEFFKKMRISISLIIMRLDNQD
jgi:hypothetical protein